MDKDQYFRIAITLAQVVARIEDATNNAEQMGNLQSLPEIIRREISVAEKTAGDELNAARHFLAELENATFERRNT